LLVGVSLLLWTFNGFGDDDDDDDSVNSANLIAVHDSSSPQYDEDCTDCHADILTAQLPYPTSMWP
jgi:hypothetical protein